jgi:hypothetical protein
MWKTSGLKKTWFMCVNQKLGEISVMMRRRDHWKISETARQAVRNFQFPRRAIRRGHRMISKTDRRVEQKIQVVRREMR